MQQLTERTIDLPELQSRLNAVRTEIQTATDEFRLINARKVAVSIQTVAKEFNVREIEVEAANLVREAEWFWHEHNPATQPREKGRGHKKAHQGAFFSKKQKEDIRKTYKELSYEELQQEQAAAVTQQEPLTRTSIKSKVKSKKEVQRAAAATERKQQREAQPPATDIQLHHCAVAELKNHVEPESIHMIITDPPYLKEYLPAWHDLAVFAEYALRPGGHLFAMSGQAYLPEVFAQMQTPGDLKYQWTIALTFQGAVGNGTIGRRITRSLWKPYLWYVKGTSSIHQQIFDLITSGGRDKDHHEWGQSVDDFFQPLEMLSAPGETVCDPFLGGGATAIAARKRGCAFIGCDVDEECIKTTLQRLE